MAYKIGIPRGLYYYRFFPLWERFFQNIGMNVVVSPATNKIIMNTGIKLSVDECCLPVKIYHGHVAELCKKTDILFIPRFTSISKDEYICPKFGGLPDVIKADISKTPKIIDTEIDMHKSKRDKVEAAVKVGRSIGVSRKFSTAAFRDAVVHYRDYRQRIKKGCFPEHILDKNKFGVSISKKYRVMILGHCYNIYDSYVNMNMVEKLGNMGAEVVTMDMFDELLLRKTCTLNKKMFWNFGTRAMGAVMNAINTGCVDGIIYLMSFGCGIDSFVCTMAEYRIRHRSSIPFSLITLDEHSGEAGVDTRLEAFMDMIEWRNSNESNLSPSG